MNILKYKSEKEIPLINPFKTVLTGFSSIKSKDYNSYVNLYFNQPSISNYLTKQALSLESLFYFQKEDIGELRRIYDYYSETFKDDIKDDKRVTFEQLKIIYRYVKVLMKKGLHSLAYNNCGIMKELSSNNKAMSQDIKKDITNLLSNIEQEYEKYKESVRNSIPIDQNKDNIPTPKSEEKQYMINKKWYEQWKSCKSEPAKPYDFFDNIDNFILCDTTKPVLRYERNKSSFSNYILKDKWENNAEIIGESEYFKLKEIFKSTCDIEYSKEEYITLKILFLVESFKPDNIRPMYMKIKKGTTFEKFITILNSLFENIPTGNDKFSFYYQKQQSSLFPLMFSYLQLEHYSTTELEKNNDNNIMDTIQSKKEDVLIIEINSNTTGNFIKLLEENHCAHCNRELTQNNKVECNKCITSQNISHYYCSTSCRDEDKIHIDYHKKVEPFLDFDYNLNILLKEVLDSNHNIELNAVQNSESNGKVGFRNLGNTCYMNAGLQCIAHCEALSTYFLSKKHKRDNINQSNELVEQYDEFIENIWNSRSKVISPDSIRTAFVSIEDKFNDYSQHDSSEMMTDFLNNLSLQLNRNGAIKYNDLNNENKDALFEWNKMLNKENSIIKDLFYGLANNNFKCKNCSHELNNYEEFLLLDLPIPDLPIKETVVKMEVNWLVQDKYPFFKMEKKEIDFKENATVKDLKEINKDLNFDVILITNQSQVIYYNDNDEIIVNSKLKDNQEGKVVFIQKVKRDKNDTKNEKEKKEMIVFIYFFYRNVEEKKEESFWDVIKNWFTLKCCCNSNMNEENNYENLNVTESPLIYSITPNLTFEEWMQSINQFLKREDSNNVSYARKQCEKNAKYSGLIKEIDQNDIQSVCSKIGDKSINFYIEITTSKYAYVNSKTKISYTAKSEVITTIKEKTKLDLYDCLNLFKENPKSYITCEICKEIPKMTTYISKNPYYLLIHLKRFYLSGHSFRKNNVSVEFKEELNIYDYISDEFKKDLEKSFFDYELFAVNVHSGGVGGGHYYAYCKVDNEWYCFNDSSVYKSSPFGEQAYVLLYKQKNPFVTETKTRK